MSVRLVHILSNIAEKSNKKNYFKTKSLLSSLGRRSLTKDKTSIEELLRQNFVQDLRRKPKFLEKLWTKTKIYGLDENQQRPIDVNDDETLVLECCIRIDRATPELEIQNFKWFLVAKVD